MGVMGCYRSGCDNIMCDTYIDSVGYICYDCQREFENYIEGKKQTEDSDGDFTEGRLEKELKVFMETEKDETVDKPDRMDVGEFFQKNG